MVGTDPSTYPLIVASNIEHRLHADRRTKVELADMLGVSETTVHRKFRGESEWRLSEIEKISAWLGLKRPDTLTRIPAKP